MHFDRASRVFITLDRIARRMNDLDIPYALVGGMAMFQHGYRRFTEDVNFLVTRESLKLIHDKLDGLGYLPPFSGSKNLKDTETGLKIEFLITGEYPGDGPKTGVIPRPRVGIPKLERHLDDCTPQTRRVETRFRDSRVAREGFDRRPRNHPRTESPS